MLMMRQCHKGGEFNRGKRSALCVQHEGREVLVESPQNTARNKRSQWAESPDKQGENIIELSYVMR